MTGLGLLESLEQGERFRLLEEGMTKTEIIEEKDDNENEIESQVKEKNVR